MSILRRWFTEVWEKGNEAAMDELIAPVTVIHSVLGGNGERAYSLATFKEMFRVLRSELAKVHVAIEQEVTQGEYSAARCVVTALYPQHLPNTNHHRVRICFTGITMVRIRNNRIVETWNHFDFETMYQQMESLG
jgi:predicted ester cyclase